MIGQIIFSLIVAVLISSVIGLLSLAIIPLSFTRKAEADRERRKVFIQDFTPVRDKKEFK